MVRNDDFHRRTVLRGVGGLLAAGVLAGCSGGGGSGGSGSGENGTGGSGSSGETGTETGAETTDSGTATTETGGSTAAGTEASTGTGGNSSGQVDQWLAGANGYDGSIADMTGSDTVEIAVGAGESGFAFDPAAVRVSPGTTIRWAWTGRGGAHNVVARDGAFDSGPPQMGGDVTYETTLDQPETYPYYCEPHRRLGMKGAVVVSR